VQATGASAAMDSWKAGKLLPNPHVNTIADGIAIKSPSERTFAYIQKYADEMVAVEDHEIASAMLLLIERAKAVVEPAGAAGIAALLTGKVKPTGKTVVIVSGGNVDVRFLSDLIEREMIRAQRYMHLFTACPDRPGGLAALLEVIAELRGNILSVVHNRISPTVPLGQTGVELLLEVRDGEHIAAIREGLRSRGYRVKMLD
jgi:threonine dehydratase